MNNPNILRIFINQLCFVNLRSGVMHKVISMNRRVHSPVSCVMVSTGLVPSVSLTAPITSKVKGIKQIRKMTGLIIKETCLLVIEIMLALSLRGAFYSDVAIQILDD